MIELELETITPGGEALARHEGMVIFVAYGIPGERVLARITVQKKRFARAEIVEVLRTAPVRTTPSCRYFGRCGSCQWQHIEYATQVGFKTAIVQEQFQRIGKFDDVSVLPTIPSPLYYGYRNRARLAITNGNRPGYRVAQSHEIVAVDDCPILEPELNRRLCDAATGLEGIGSDWELRPADPKMRIGDFVYTVSAASFFQANTAIAAHLVDEMFTRLDLNRNARVLDLYCGVGLFTLPLSLRAAHVTGVEANADASADARINLAALKVDHPHMADTVILTATVEAALAETDIATRPWDAVVLDPPRAGVDRDVLTRLLDLQPAQIVYVSCDPATLARDCRILVDGGYTLDPVQPLDMFPQTYHVECIVRLRRRDGVTENS